MYLLGAAVPMQEIYCFLLPFIVKWVVAALVVSVLVNLFSRLRQQGDHSHSSVVTQVQGLLLEWWQRKIHHAPSSQNMLLSLIKLNGRGSAFKAMPSFIRYQSNRRLLVSLGACKLELGYVDAWRPGSRAPANLSPPLAMLGASHCNYEQSICSSAAGTLTWHAMHSTAKHHSAPHA